MGEVSNAPSITLSTRENEILDSEAVVISGNVSDADASDTIELWYTIDGGAEEKHSSSITLSGRTT